MNSPKGDPKGNVMELIKQLEDKVRLVKTQRNYYRRSCYAQVFKSVGFWAGLSVGAISLLIWGILK